ncbi:MAG: sodium-dependent transporter [Calditrichae bacterium]|nr:sodium-dependent transporter [Calditrichota bacterium]MCB9057534.1 sodium-dependent transporter [Calditrichia bacterium]
MSDKVESFTSRFGLIAATLGMAIGAGNIWRFPRLAGQYGGSFIIPWFIFLFLWSIPLLLVEFSVGIKTKKGVLGAFSDALGKRYTWMGWFVAFCTSAIMFYYSVVSGWSLKYFVLAVTDNLNNIDHGSFWTTYTDSFLQPSLFHLLALFIAATFIYLGIVKGIERFSKIIIPILYGLLIVSAIKALNLDNSDIGLHYLFAIDVDKLLDYKIWLEGLSQSAWSTGAGWGLILTYAVYAKSRKGLIGNVFITGLGNNMASIFAGLVIIPTVFALSLSTEAAGQVLASGNQGLAFIAIPKLFSQMSGGGIFSTIFFLSLFFAALSSLISMLELASRVVMDFGISRKKAILLIAGITAFAGLPSAMSMKFFNNQDWVWGLGLMVSGALFAVLVIKIGVQKFVDEWLQPQKNKKAYSLIFKVLFYLIIPVEFLAMLGWWLYQSVSWLPDSSWDIFESYSIATTFLQWGIIIAIGLLLNNIFNNWMMSKNDN